VLTVEVLPFFSQGEEETPAESLQLQTAAELQVRVVAWGDRDAPGTPRVSNTYLAAAVFPLPGIRGGKRLSPALKDIFSNRVKLLCNGILSLCWNIINNP